MLDSRNTDALWEAAMVLHQSGDLRGAEAQYRAILAHTPDHAPSLHLLGMLRLGLGDVDKAAALVSQALALDPQAAPFHVTHATILRAQGHLADAVTALRTADRLRPATPQILCNLGSLLLEQGELHQALAAFAEAAGLDLPPPLAAEIHYNYGNALAAAGRVNEAIAAYRAAPAQPDAAFNLGGLLLRHARFAEAEAALRHALILRPGHASTWANLGIALQQQNRFGDAISAYTQALAWDPADAETRFNLGCAHLATGRMAEAAAIFAAAPSHAGCRLGSAIATLPIVYEDTAEIQAARAAYGTALDGLIQDAPTLPDLADALGTIQPFYLPYQGHNDLALQRRYGALICTTLAQKSTTPLVRERSTHATKHARLRIGLVSGYFCDHTIWKLFLESWLTLDPARFELIAYHTGTTHDARTAQTARHATLRTNLGPHAAWQAAIHADAPDALLYPEIGMDPLAARLAAQRLAPFQAVAWGHPTTTGYTTIDAFLSSALMEPPDGAAHYHEPLIPLPNLGTCYRPDIIEITPSPRTALGLREDAVVYWSAQSLPKYTPAHDALYPRIARAVPNAQFVFIDFPRNPALTRRLHTRLTAAFAAEGLDARGHIVILPHMPQRDFLATCAASDIILDTPGWSGGRSTLDCLVTDPVLVTWPGTLMRSRHTAAILTHIGLTETIATSAEDTIALATRLGQDPAARQALRTRMAQAKYLAFNDTCVLHALESLLETKCAPAHSPEFA